MTKARYNAIESNPQIIKAQGYKHTNCREIFNKDCEAPSYPYQHTAISDKGLLLKLKTKSLFNILYRVGNTSTQYLRIDKE